MQADLLDSNRFAEACSAWAVRKDTPLASLLVERGWQTPEDRDRVEQVLQRKLKKHSGDVRASLAEGRYSIASATRRSTTPSPAVLLGMASHNRLPGGKYLGELFREGTLLGNRPLPGRRCQSQGKRSRSSTKVAARPIPRTKATAIHGWCVGGNAAMTQFPDHPPARELPPDVAPFVRRASEIGR